MNGWMDGRTDDGVIRYDVHSVSMYTWTMADGVSLVTNDNV